VKVAFLTTDHREPFKENHKEAPWFGMAMETVLSGFTQFPELEVHVISCLRQPARMPEKLADNIWFHGLVVPKIAWMRTLYLGCILATWRKIKAIQPNIVHGQGAELDCAISAIFSGRPYVITLHNALCDHRARS
jgi:hypothetical protein